MERKLDKDLESLLHTRVELSRRLRIFTYTEITTGWGMSRATFTRYVNPAYRARSLEDARRAYKMAKTIDRKKCWRCLEGIKGHRRCADCTIFMHTSTERCDGCIDAKFRSKMGYVRI